MDTTVAGYLDSILYIKAVETNSPSTYRRRKGAPQQSHLIVIDIYISKDILHHDTHDIPRLEQITHTC